MKSLPRPYIIFICMILIPGLILGWLSFNTIRQDKQLAQQQVEQDRLEFVNYLKTQLNKRETLFLKSIQNRKSSPVGPSQKPQERFTYFSSWLHEPYVSGILLLDSNLNPYPARRTLPDTLGYAFPASSELSWMKNKYCIEPLSDQLPNRVLSHGYLGSSAESIFLYQQFQCILKSSSPETITDKALELLRNFSPKIGFADHQQIHFILNLLLEQLINHQRKHGLSSEKTLQLQSDVSKFYSNVSHVWSIWAPRAALWAQMSGRDLQPGLTLFSDSGQLYARLSDPLLWTKGHLFLQLKQEYFLPLQDENLKSNWPQDWKAIHYNITDYNGYSWPKGSSGQKVQKPIEYIMSGQIIQSKLLLETFPHPKFIQLQKRKTLLMGLLLGLSLLILMAGTLAVVLSIREERNSIRMRTNFLSAVTHELKSPLTSIRLLAELLESGRQTDPDKITRYAGSIALEVQRLQKMVENVLSRTRQDHLSSEKNYKLNLSDLAKSISDSFSSVYKKKGVYLECEIEPNILYIGYASSLESIINNLLDNALKYTQAKGKVSFRLNTNDACQVVLSFSDTGMGIDKSEQKKIFRPFYRVEDELTRASQGSGLGLALVQKSVEIHFGSLHLESSLGKGSCFTVILPGKELGFWAKCMYRYKKGWIS